MIGGRDAHPLGHLGVPPLEALADAIAEQLAVRPAALATRAGDVDDQVGRDGHLSKMVPAAAAGAGVESAAHAA